MYGYHQAVPSGMPGGTVAAVRLLEMKSDGHLATQCRVNWLPRFPCAPLPPTIKWEHPQTTSVSNELITEFSSDLSVVYSITHLSFSSTNTDLQSNLTWKSIGLQDSLCTSTTNHQKRSIQKQCWCQSFTPKINQTYLIHIYSLEIQLCIQEKVVLPGK